MKKRLAGGEFELTEELKHFLAARPMIGRPLRVPDARKL